MRINVNDYIGRRFGRLTVLEYVGLLAAIGESGKRTHYKCRCDCGKSVVISRHMLQQGKRTSCGDCTGIINHGSYCEYICENGESFLFDTEDYRFVTGKRWHMNNKGYAVIPVHIIECQLKQVIVPICASDRNDTRKRISLASIPQRMVEAKCSAGCY